MDRPAFARHVVQRPSNPKILKELKKSSRVRIGTVDRNTIYVFKPSIEVTHGAPGSVARPLALAQNVKSAYPADRAITLVDVLVVSDMDPTDMVVTVLVPNTKRHRLLFSHMPHPVANFGALDDCVFPECQRCRRSVQCLGTGICHVIGWTGRFSKLASEFEFAPGSQYNEMSLAVGSPGVYTSTRGQGLTRFDFGVWLRTETDAYGEKYLLEFEDEK